MAVNVYEGMFLLSSNRLQSDWDKAAEIVHNILTKYGAEILASRPWDERQLVYQIRKETRGMYYLAYFKIDGSKIQDIRRECRLNENILRELILKVHPKLVDQMIAQITGEAQQVAPEEIETHVAEEEELEEIEEEEVEVEEESE